MAEKKRMYQVVNPDADLKFERKMRSKDPEERYYLICIRAAAQSDMPDEWHIVSGRTEAREVIINAIDYIDFEESFVLVETCTLNDRKSIYTFMKYIEQFFNDGFDIDDYVKGDWSEDDYIRHNDIDTSIYNNLREGRVSMVDMMNGKVNIQSLE
jgi:hypothetical protein